MAGCARSAEMIGAIFMKFGRAPTTWTIPGIAGHATAAARRAVRTLLAPVGEQADALAGC